MLETMPTDPIVEAIFDIRFDCFNPLIGSLILEHFSASKMKLRFPDTTQLPLSHSQSELARVNPALTFQPEFIMQGNKEFILIGSGHLTISIEEPYPGWKVFKSDILEMLNLIEHLDEDIDVSRVAFRYINLLKETNMSNSTVEQIHFNGSLGEFDLQQNKVTLKMELNQQDIQHNIKVKSHEVVTNEIDDSVEVGALLDIDTFSTSGLSNFWQKKEAIIDRIRSAERNIFESLMEKDALKRFQNLLSPTSDSGIIDNG